MRIVYQMTGSFGGGSNQCEDFLSENSSVGATIETKDLDEDDWQRYSGPDLDLPDGWDHNFVVSSDDGWVDAIVRRFDQESIRRVLANINDCEPEDIEIVEMEK